MPLSDAEKRRMISATYDAAKNMVDDLVHMREIIAKPMPARGDLRRMSNLLRRILIDNNGDLRKIAPPRLSRRLHLLAPVLDETAGKKQPWYLASIGSSDAYELSSECGFAVPDLVVPDPVKIDIPAVTLAGSSPKPVGRYSTYGKPDDGHKKIADSLPVHRFLSQPVLYFARKWASRADVIKFVANIGSGVHSGNPKEEPIYDALHQIRQVCSLRPGPDGQRTLRVYNPLIILAGEPPIDIEPDGGVDLVLLQLMAAARFLTDSPDVIELERIIFGETLP